MITTINRGGAENHLTSLVKGQLAHGWKVDVVYLKGNGYWAAEFERMGATVTALKLRAYGDPLPLWRLRRLLRQTNPDVLHAHMPPAELYCRVALFLASSSATRYVVTKHNDESFFRGPGQQWVGRWAARRADWIIAISGAVKSFVTGPALGCEPDKTEVIHYGIDPEPFARVGSQAVASLRRAWDVPPDACLIGTVARFVPQKALHVLLTSFASYIKRGHATARLVLVGGGPLEPELRRLSNQLGIDDYVIWAGYREDMPTVFAALDVFALTSIYEGFGLVLLEAMASGKAVVATAVSAIPEVITDGASGMLVPVGDSAALAEAFCRLEDRVLRERLGAAGRNRAIANFGVAAMVTRTLAAYGTTQVASRV